MKSKKVMEVKPRRLLTFDQLEERGVLLGRRQVDRLEAEGKFPRRVPISDWRCGWVATEVDNWVDEKIAARSTEIGALGTGDAGRRGR